MEYNYLVVKPQTAENPLLYINGEKAEFDTEFISIESIIRIKLICDNFEDFESDVVLGEETLNTIEPQLVEKTKTNRYIILSNNLPENCLLTVNDEEKEFDTEYLTELQEIIVIVTHDGFNSYEEKISLIDELNEINPVMEPIKYKVLAVDLDEDVIVTINGIETKELEVNDGEYVKVVMTKNECYPVTEENNEIHENWEVSANFFPINYELTILTKDSESLENIVPDDIYIDGLPVDSKHLLKAGTYKIQIVKYGYETLEGDIQVTDNKTIIAKIKPLEHTVKVQTMNDYTVMFDGEVSETREIKVLHGRVLQIDITGEKKEPWNRISKITEDENLVIELMNITHNLIFDNIETFDRVILINQETNKIMEYTNSDEPITICENSRYHVGVEIAGYKPFETIFESQDFDVVLTVELFKPTVCLSAINSESEQIPAIITINDKVVNSGESIIYDYDSELNIKIECEGYQTITETIKVFEDYIRTYTMSQQPPKELDLKIKIVNYTGIDDEIVLVVDNEKIELNEKLECIVKVIEGIQSKIEITNNHNSIDIVDFVTLFDNDDFKRYELMPQKYHLKVNTVPENAIVFINGVQGNEATINSLSDFNLCVKAENFETYSKVYVMPCEDTEIDVVLNIDSSANMDNEDIFNVSFEDICKMLMFKKLYNYIYIGHILQEKGITEDSVKEFYYSFAPYLTDKFDIYLWYCMKHHYGIIDENQPLARPL